jgi:hypothetical protein
VAQPVETLQAKNLRVLHADVLPQVLAKLEKLLGAPVRVTHTRAEGSEVVVLAEGTRPWFGGKNPPRFRARYDVATRWLTTLADLYGTGEWRYIGVRNPAKYQFLGREVTLVFDITELGIHEAFARLPSDERAAAEFVRHRLEGTPYGGPELLVPHDSDEVAGNARYLYLATWKHLLVRDGTGGFTGWRWVGVQGGKWLLAATEDHLFGTSNVGPIAGPTPPPMGQWQLYVRPATAEPAEWTALGPMAPGFHDSLTHAHYADWRFGIAAAGGWLFAESTGGTLWARPGTPRPADWKPVGRRPTERGKLLGSGDRLYFLGSDGRLWERPAGPLEADWRPLGEVGAFRTATTWAGRLVCWNPPTRGGQVLARPLGPPLGAWTPIGRVDPGESFLGHKW